jgi:FkbH-like protein
MPLDDRAIAISANFTAESLEPGLNFWRRELGFDYEIRFAGYNQVFQQLLDPDGLFGRNRRGVNVVLVRPDDAYIAELRDTLRSAATTFSAPLIAVVCPTVDGTPISHEDLGVSPTIHTIMPQDVLSLYPVKEIEDPHAQELGDVPYTPAFFTALATAIVRKIHAVTTKPYKVVALDCDDTLWAGVCGEDGPDGVVIDTPRRSLQEFMLERRSEGMLLAIASKNNEEDVLATFRAHPEMPLRMEDFAVRRINWESKGVSLPALADELGLGLDSLILVDDSAKECEEAAASAPEVLALPIPARAEEIPDFLRHVWAFDRTRVTEEDRKRPEMYRQEAERARARNAAGSLEEFLASLELQVRIEPMQPEQAARVAQLTQRTNQMNTSGIRRTEAEVRALGESGLEILTVSVKDRFGDYGLTGAVIFGAVGGVLVVDTFLLSCRVLGRGVENQMAERLEEIARSRGLSEVDIRFTPLPRNKPAALFLEARGGAGFSLPRQADRPAPPDTSARTIDYFKIASELRDPEVILARIHAGSARAIPTAAQLDPPRTALERELAGLWAELLNVPAVGVHDNFFALGGHSLLAVQLLSRVRQTYGVDLSLEIVYSGEFTVAELAKAVELKEFAQAGADYGELLEEVENLSDEEVRALLAAEQE